jgi:hypothetical protein
VSVSVSVSVCAEVQVCNEPSPAIPAGVLCDYYERAISILRSGGMHAANVAVILLIYKHILYIYIYISYIIRKILSSVLARRECRGHLSYTYTRYADTHIIIILYMYYAGDLTHLHLMAPRGNSQMLACTWQLREVRQHRVRFALLSRIPRRYRFWKKNYSP